MARRRKRERGPDGPLTSWLKAKIKACGVSHAQLAKMAGVSQSQISRFMSSNSEEWQSLNLETVDKLIPVLDSVYVQKLDAERDKMAFSEAYGRDLKIKFEAAIRTFEELMEIRDAAAMVSDFMDRLHDQMEA